MRFEEDMNRLTRQWEMDPAFPPEWAWRLYLGAAVAVCIFASIVLLVQVLP